MAKKTAAQQAQERRKNRHYHNPQERYGKKHANANKLSCATCISDKHIPVTVPHEFQLGPFRVVHSRKQHYRLYTIFGPDNIVIGKQISYPSIGGCLDNLKQAAAAGKVGSRDAASWYKSSLPLLNQEEAQRKERQNV